MFFSFSFLRVRACFPPRRALLSTFFFFSLSHCETPQLGCRSRVSSLLLSLEISPDQATRQLPSPNLKEITPNAASCRCGRGEKRTKEDALLGASIFGTSCRNHRALSTSPQACCPLKTSSVAKNSMCLSTTSKIRQREPRPLPSEPRKRRRGFGRHDIARSISSSSRFQTEEKQNARLRSRRRAEQDDPREQREHRRSGLHGGGFEENLSKGREEKRKRGRRKCEGCAANCSTSSFETFYGPCPCLFPLPLSSANQPRRLPSLLPLL